MISYFRTSGSRSGLLPPSDDQRRAERIVGLFKLGRHFTQFANAPELAVVVCWITRAWARRATVTSSADIGGYSS